MKLKKIFAGAIACLLVASVALVGCSSSSSNSNANSNAATQATEDGDLGLVNPGKLTMITSPDYPPFENLVDNEVIGYEVDLFNLVAEQMGLELEIVPMQFDAIIPAIVSGGQGDIGVSGFSVDPQRAQEINFTEAFYIDDQAIAVMNDSAITEENAATALNDPSVIIAVQTGTTGEDYALENYPNAQVQGYGNSTDCFAALQAGTANAVCTNLAVVDSMLETAYTDARIVVQSATGEEYAAVISKENTTLLDKINEILDQLDQNGTIEELRTKWF